MEWKDLPREIIFEILAKYDGRFSVRNGRLMTKLAENAALTRLLGSISPKYRYITDTFIDIVYVALPINRHKQYFISLYDGVLSCKVAKVWNDYGDEDDN